jgi:hypothetical protein
MDGERGQPYGANDLSRIGSAALILSKLTKPPGLPAAPAAARLREELVIMATTRPVSLTTRDALVAKAEAWIASNGQPHVGLVEQAIRRSELAGDPFCDNPFRLVLLEVAAGVTR